MKNIEEPIEYVRGFTEFLGCKIDLSKRPLIPRRETEFWVARVIEELKNLLKIENCKLKIRCLDMFAGSGCIGIAVLCNAQNVLCDFADKEKKCLSQIKINLKKNFVNKNKYRVIKSDVFSGLPRRLRAPRNDGCGYDFVFANPPYVAKNKKNKIQKSVLKYEPKMALFGGADGMFFINKFLKQAKNYLNLGGQIFMEFSPEQKNKIEKLIKKYKYLKWEFKKDQFDRWRWVILTFELGGV